MTECRHMLASDKQTAELVGLFKRGTKLTYNKGEYIIRPGESPSAVYYIEEGLVKAFNISKYGEENLLIIRKSHEIFPLIWSLTGIKLDINYQALNPTTVWRIDPETYINFLQQHTSVLPPLLDIIIEQYRIHSLRILNLEYRTVRERLISFLIMMSERFGKETKDGVMIDVPLRHQDIASSINATRETASRQLSVLERKGLIAQKQAYITLKDMPALRAFL
ncbi:MAG TPA: Crp/Fnr family transcriptional regulator [Candidatus Saccharimonadales bacterium]|nr:Crp/Fnr family transcriptional regulator [Candidatus Saccharimonadales bacterium]